MTEVSWTISVPAPLPLTGYSMASKRFWQKWVHSGNPLIKHSALVSFPSSPHFPTALTEFPVIAPQIKLTLSLLLGKPTLRHLHPMPWEGESQTYSRGEQFSLQYFWNSNQSFGNPNKDVVGAQNSPHCIWSSGTPEGIWVNKVKGFPMFISFSFWGKKEHWTDRWQ